MTPEIAHNRGCYRGTSGAATGGLQGLLQGDFRGCYRGTSGAATGGLQGLL